MAPGFTPAAAQISRVVTGSRPRSPNSRAATASRRSRGASEPVVEGVSTAMGAHSKGVPDSKQALAWFGVIQAGGPAAAAGRGRDRRRYSSADEPVACRRRHRVGRCAAAAVEPRVLQGRVGRQRRGGGVPAAQAGFRHRGAGPGPADGGRPDRAQARARGRPQPAHPGADRAGRARASRRGPAGRCGRLPDQALRLPRAGGAPAGAAAPWPPGGPGRPAARPEPGPQRAPCHGGWRAGGAEPPGMDAAGAAAHRA
mmetsp:Transcript_6302/g.25504  ORF Transcript_6302/g.25504 Transcript_6302/m.25504 type:complete len:256 (+) Transcript_6302:303-1070(+)